MSATSTMHAQLGQSQQLKFDGRLSGAQEKAKSTSLKIETLSQYIYVTNEGNLGRSIYMLKLAQAESDFGLKSQHDDTSQKTNLKTNPKVKLKLSNN